MNTRTILIALAALAFPAVAWAHPDGGHAHGFFAGLTHPLSGLDHLVAAAAVGVWGGSLRGTALWLLPVAFVSGMAGGIFTGAGVASSGVELAIATSVIVLGLFLALRTHLDVRIAAALVACAGLAHGAGHAAEADPALPAFAVGALITTALLHAAGVGLAITLNARSTIPLRAAGAAAAIFGVWLVAGILSA